MYAHQNVMEFYRNLPPKVCVDCGKKMNEQCESYINQCDHCLSKAEE